MQHASEENARTLRSIKDPCLTTDFEQKIKTKNSHDNPSLRTPETALETGPHWACLPVSYIDSILSYGDFQVQFCPFNSTSGLLAAFLNEQNFSLCWSYCSVFPLKNYFYNYLTQTTTVSLKTFNSTGTLSSTDSKRPEEPIPDTTGGIQGRLTDDQRPLSKDRDGNVSSCYVITSSVFICVSMQLFAYPLVLGQQETELSLTPEFLPNTATNFFLFLFFLLETGPLM